MNNNIFFIAGIHGVGKTTLCKHISKKYSLEHYSASTLISEKQNSTFDTLYIKNIIKNQNTLIDVINEKFDKSNQYLLDGHFCLLNDSKFIEKIPKETFELLGIKMIIVLTENVSTIYTRLKKRTGIEYSIDILQQLQESELDYSHKISLELNIPYIVLNLSNLNEIKLNKKFDTIFKGLK